MRKMSLLFTSLFALSFNSHAQDVPSSPSSSVSYVDASAVKPIENQALSFLDVRIENITQKSNPVLAVRVNTPKGVSPSTFNIYREKAYIAASSKNKEGEIVLAPGVAEESVSGRVEHPSVGPSVLHMNINLMGSEQKDTPKDVSVLEAKNYQVSMIIPNGTSEKNFKLGDETYKVSLDYKNPEQKN